MVRDTDQGLMKMWNTGLLARAKSSSTEKGAHLAAALVIEHLEDCIGVMLNSHACKVLQSNDDVDGGGVAIELQ